MEDQWEAGCLMDWISIGEVLKEPDTIPFPPPTPPPSSGGGAVRWAARAVVVRGRVGRFFVSLAVHCYTVRHCSLNGG